MSMLQDNNNLILLILTESSCVGITFNPGTMIWSLKTSTDTDESISTVGYISYLKECIEQKSTADSGKLSSKNLS